MYAKNNILEYLLTDELIFVWFYTYMYTFSHTAEKENDVSLRGISWLMRSISTICCRSAHIYHLNPQIENSFIHSLHSMGS